MVAGLNWMKRHDTVLLDFINPTGVIEELNSRNCQSRRIENIIDKRSRTLGT